jgi:hypothetical protein
MVCVSIRLLDGVYTRNLWMTDRLPNDTLLKPYHDRGSVDRGGGLCILSVLGIGAYIFYLTRVLLVVVDVLIETVLVS